jgi:hypothetical protein
VSTEVRGEQHKQRPMGALSSRTSSGDIQQPKQRARCRTGEELCAAFIGKGEIKDRLSATLII